MVLDKKLKKTGGASRGASRGATYDATKTCTPKYIKKIFFKLVVYKKYLVG